MSTIDELSDHSQTWRPQVQHRRKPENCQKAVRTYTQRESEITLRDSSMWKMTLRRRSTPDAVGRCSALKFQQSCIRPQPSSDIAGMSGRCGLAPPMTARITALSYRLLEKGGSPVMTSRRVIPNEYMSLRGVHENNGASSSSGSSGELSTSGAIQRQGLHTPAVVTCETWEVTSCKPWSMRTAVPSRSMRMFDCKWKYNETRSFCDGLNAIPYRPDVTVYEINGMQVFDALGHSEELNHSADERWARLLRTEVTHQAPGIRIGGPDIIQNRAARTIWEDEARNRTKLHRNPVASQDVVMVSCP